MLHAAIKGNFSAFEFFSEHGATTEIDYFELDMPIDTSVIDRMLNRRQEWIDVIASLVRDRGLPLIAARTVHDYAVGFNWAAVYAVISSRLGKQKQSKTKARTAKK